ncbi:TPM domain-containing protein [Candidatus Bipolaricaulota bacterium]|nr:TPM domain-containing protein [Candidatus Bipolaricaulota bacterium]
MVSAARLIIPLTLSLIILASLPSLSISLPDRIGRLNDYGNILTMENQRNLREKITQLEDKKIGLTLLISTRDPYLNPDIFASKIRAKWGIQEGINENFVLFVQGKEGWAVRTFFTPTVLNLFSSEDFKNYQETLKKRASSGDIRSGALYAVKTIYRKAFPPKKKKDQSTEKSGGLSLAHIIGGIVGGVLLITVLVRREAMKRCPQCGSRLNISRVHNEFTDETIKNCPDCGYTETE